MVTTGQEVALLDSKKAVNFLKQLGVKVLGIVENMADFPCPHCGERINLFKAGGGEKAAKALAVPFLGRVVYRFGIADSAQHYHLPFKVTPWGYSCFRGGA